jgi:hypothetical protein
MSPATTIRPTYFYLKKGSTSYSKLLMFHNYSANQMIIEIYGLDGSKATMTHAFPDKIVKKEELSAVDFRWSDALEINRPIEHVTCHKDGTFHIKTTNDADLYVERMKHPTPIGPNVDPFLDVKLVSELCERHQPVQLPLKEPNTWVSVPENHALCMEGAFAGVRYDLEGEFTATILHRSGANTLITPIFRLLSGTIKGVFHYYTSAIPAESYRNKPQGTLISFKFPVDDKYCAIKAFFFR